MRTLWSHFLPSSRSCFFSDLLCILADYQSAAVSPSASFPETSRYCADAQQHWEEAAFPVFHETQRNCEEVEGPGGGGHQLKGTVASVTKESAKADAYKPMTCITHGCYRRRFVGGGRKKKAAASACNSAAHVRKSEFPGMLF